MLNIIDQDIDAFISLSSQISKIMLQQLNITVEEKTATILQTQTLSYLEQNTKCKMSELANHLHASLSSTTQLIERLVVVGAVKRFSDSGDRRVVLLSITDLGLKKLNHMKEERRERIKKLFLRVDKKDIKELIRIQEKILKSLQENPNL